MMKMNKKNIAVILCCGFSLCGMFAQEESNIELPDLTTVVGGEASELDSAELPDFADVIALPEKSSPLVPELPKVEYVQKDGVSQPVEVSEDSQIYAEGQIGGGYPAVFVGDFAISRITGNNPFTIAFNHISDAGYSGSSLSSGYNSENTMIKLTRDYKGEKLLWSLGGFYSDAGNGLQQKLPGVAAVDQQDISGFGTISWQLPYGFSLSSKINGKFYTRYADISDPLFVCDDWIRKSDMLNFVPVAKAEWQGYGFHTGLTAAYGLSADIGGFVEGIASNRGEFKLDFGWANKYISVNSDVAAVVGNYIGENKALVPFTVGVDGIIPVSFADRNCTMGISGGMKSTQTLISELEKQYLYSSFSYIPNETTDWFVNFHANLPVQSWFTGSLNVDFAKTAFGNGKYEPLYAGSGAFKGLYDYVKVDQTILATNIGFSFHYKIFSASTGLKSNWFDVPVLDTKQLMYVNLSVQEQKGKWGANLETQWYFVGEDKTPLINMDGFWQLTPAVKLVLSVEDFCKLVDDTDRIYAGKYISEGGSITMLVKFLF